MKPLVGVPTYIFHGARLPVPIHLFIRWTCFSPCFSPCETHLSGGYAFFANLFQVFKRKNNRPAASVKPKLALKIGKQLLKHGWKNAWMKNDRRTGQG
jgi:hypothetical protein